mmetsp:Transcript_44139/g.115993  ORF Transcript_44139/g.115993 Transcript_44139/m.115993 type:complete len:136 (+) Transcript_44139:56-463(+)|eukprot:CAMPEP_0115875328 /NCGR_PEP_ID=MMETSP0287-20121206/25039_1 /TAXON_ID=412157 /ORGANISM="Chrysochromulina rotalis, Strain UIO044" /LENGTH=135 /DNA_ID=CAMNT_0003330585 /DNA_START=49 /DNA_END=456 /DNA_ORIENTATION=+
MTSPLAHLGLTGTASLAEELDKRMLVQLRDGRKIIGLLRSFDQFANVVLEEAVERIIVDKRYADVPLGLYVIRGENVVLLGEMDDAKEAHATTALLTAAPVEELLVAKREAEEAQKLKAGLSRVARSVNDAWDLE